MWSWLPASHKWWMPASERHSHSGPKEQVAAAWHGALEDSFCSDDSQKWRCSCCDSRFGIYSVAHAKAPTVQGTGEEVANATAIRDCASGAAVGNSVSNCSDWKETRSQGHPR